MFEQRWPPLMGSGPSEEGFNALWNAPCAEIMQRAAMLRSLSAVSPEIARPSAHIIAHVPHRVPTSRLPGPADPVVSSSKQGPQTQVLDRPRNAPTAQNSSPGAQTLGYLLFLLGLSHANAQRQTEIKSAPPTSFSRAPTQSDLGAPMQRRRRLKGASCPLNLTSPGLLAAGR